jgi:hypothetical protein
MPSPITSGPLAGAEVGSVVVTAEGRMFPVTYVNRLAVWFAWNWCALPSGFATCLSPEVETTVRLATCQETALYRAREREKAREAELLATATKGLQ